MNDFTLPKSRHNITRINRAFIIILTLCLPVSKTDLINCRSCQLWQEAFSLETSRTGGIECLQTLQPLSINAGVCSNPDSSLRHAPNFVSQLCLIYAHFSSLHAGINEPINSEWEYIPVYCSRRCFVSCILQSSCGVQWQESLKRGVWCHFNHLYLLVWNVGTSPAIWQWC